MKSTTRRHVFTTETRRHRDPERTLPDAQRIARRRYAAAAPMKNGGNTSDCFVTALAFPPFFMSALVGRLAGRRAMR
jgi:hypothetical protein